MNKTKWMRRYVFLSILIGFALIFVSNQYINGFGGEIYGEVTKSLFTVSVENYFATVPVFNTPIIVFLVLAILNGVLYYFTLQMEELKGTALQDVAIMNAIIVFTMILGQFLLIFLIPDRINGVIANRIIYVEFPRLSTDIVRAFTPNYILAFGYIFYNMYVAVRTMPEKELIEEEPEEELDNLLQD